MQQQGAADSNEGAYGAVSVIADRRLQQPCDERLRFDEASRRRRRRHGRTRTEDGIRDVQP